MTQKNDHNRVYGKKILQKLLKPAEFGDILNSKTKIDPKIRKGFDVQLITKIYTSWIIYCMILKVYLLKKQELIILKLYHIN